MYAPLQFLNQCANYFQIEGDNDLAHLIQQKMNKGTLDWVHNNITAKEYALHKFMMAHNITYSLERDRLSEEYKQFDATEILTDMFNSFTKTVNDTAKNIAVMTNYSDTMEDFGNYVINNAALEIWKYHKLTYKVTDYIGKAFFDMKMPEILVFDYVSNVPSTCFYIDFGEVGNRICEDAVGVFMVTTKLDNTLIIEFITLIQGRHGRLMPVYSCIYNVFDVGEEEFYANNFDTSADDEEVFEDGVKRIFHRGMLTKFYLNFMIYLHASNKVVQKTGRTIKNEKKLSREKRKEPKNDMKELIEYEVGYRVSSDVTRIVNTDNQTVGMHKGNHSSKSPHYRSAHWHSYWTGSKEDNTNRKLIVKWVDGVFVNGKVEQPNAVVHTVR